jgi:hypothetical protein
MSYLERGAASILLGPLTDSVAGRSIYISQRIRMLGPVFGRHVRPASTHDLMRIHTTFQGISSCTPGKSSLGSRSKKRSWGSPAMLACTRYDKTIHGRH